MLSGESCRCTRLLKPLDNEVLPRVINLKPEVAAIGFRLLFTRQNRQLAGLVCKDSSFPNRITIITDAVMVYPETSVGVVRQLNNPPTA